MAKDGEKPTTPETDLEKEIKKALRIEYEVGRYKWLTGQAPMTPMNSTPVRLPLLPKSKSTDPVPLNEFVHSGTWVVAEARRMKDSGEIPPRIIKTDFAKALASRMRVAAEANPSIRPLKWRSIINELETWGLWPITSI